MLRNADVRRNQMSEELKIQHVCERCAELSKMCAEQSKMYANLSKRHAELSEDYAKHSKERAEKCQCKEKSDE